MARHKRPGIKVLFTARPEFAQHAEGVGEFMSVPIAIRIATSPITVGHAMMT
jgi:hypothetical protein